MEDHPWMRGLTYGTIATGFFVAVIFGGSGTSDGTALALIGALLAVGGAWSIRISSNFKQWESLQDGQKVICTLLMLPGIFAGVVLLGVMGEFMSAANRDRD